MCRNQERGQKAVQEIKEATGNDDIILAVVDVGRPAEIIQYTNRFLQGGSRLV